MVEVDGEVWDSVAKWLELTGLVKQLLRLKQPRPVSRAFGTRNMAHIARALYRLRSLGLVEEATLGNVRYVYLTERACKLLVLLGRKPEELACGDVALKLLKSAVTREEISGVR